MGEPLLELPRIFAIVDYCHFLSNKIRKEILPTFVCNGTLLTREIAQSLHDHGILFGISLDGLESEHNLNRIDVSGNGSYQAVYNGLLSGSNPLMGIAITLTNTTSSFVAVYESFKDLCGAISIKPVRFSPLDRKGYDIQFITNRYNELYEYFVENIRKGDIKPLLTFLNGDDYFGKFIARILLNTPVLQRCDAGTARFFLGPDNLKHVCPAAYKTVLLNESELPVLSAGCLRCLARFTCGGWCRVDYKNSSFNPQIENLCEINRHLYYLSIRLCSLLFFEFESIREKLYIFCQKKNNRYKKDLGLEMLLDCFPGRDFISLKKEYDSNGTSLLESLLDAKNE